MEDYSATARRDFERDIYKLCDEEDLAEAELAVSQKPRRSAGPSEAPCSTNEPITLDPECDSCAEEQPLNECPNSQRPCGHHCNHSWTHDSCCWCGAEFGEDS